MELFRKPDIGEGCHAPQEDVTTFPYYAAAAFTSKWDDLQIA